MFTVDWSPDGTQLVYGGEGSDGQSVMETIQFPVANAGLTRTSPTTTTAAQNSHAGRSGSSDSDGTIVSYSWSENRRSSPPASIRRSIGSRRTHYHTTVTDDDGATDSDDVVITVETPSITCDFTIPAGE